MKWTVERYVLREVVQTWLAVTGVLVAILISNQLSRVLGQAADNQYGRHVVFDLIALGAVMNLSVIVPVGLLLAMVLTLGRLYHDSEMAALQACGFGPSRLLAPLFCFAVVIAVGSAGCPSYRCRGPTGRRSCCASRRIKEAQFGQLDAGRFRSFSGGDMRCSMPSASIADGVLHNVFVQRESAGRIEVALADTADLFQGRRRRHALRDPVQRPALRGRAGARRLPRHRVPRARHPHRDADRHGGTARIRIPSRRASCWARTRRLRHRPAAVPRLERRSWRWC